MSRQVRFDRFEVDLSTGELRRNGSRVALQEKPFRILETLLESPGRLVSRHRLQGRLWPPSTHVDFEHGLNVAVRKLRQALGDEAGKPRFVETLPGRGYRFIAPVTWSGSNRGANRITLAIRPFRNLSPGAPVDHFEEGVSQEITSLLSSLDSGRLAVIAQTSLIHLEQESLEAGEIGRRLGADLVLEGSLRISDAEVRLSLQLIEVSSRCLWWCRIFQSPCQAPFSAQRRLAEEAVGSLAAELRFDRPELSAPGQSEDSEAYKSFLKGLHSCQLRDVPNLQKARCHFLQAVERDPGFASAWACLADSYNLLVDYGILHPRRGFAKARRAAQRALQIHPGQGLGHAALAFVHHRHDWDWGRAEAEYRQAVRLNPSSAAAHHRYAEFLSQMGRNREALDRIAQARSIDPLSPIIHAVEGWILFHARHYDRAQQSCLWALELQPGFSVAEGLLARIDLQAGSAQRAVERLSMAVQQPRVNPFVLTTQAIGCALSGDQAAAQASLRRLQRISRRRYVSAFLLAKVHLALGECDHAFELLQKAFDERCGWLLDLQVDPELKELQGDPRFVSLCRRVGHPEIPADSAAPFGM